MTIMGGNASWFRNCGGNLDRTQEFHKERPQNLWSSLPGIGTEMLRATPSDSPGIKSTRMSTERWTSEGAAEETKYKVLQRCGSVDNHGSSAPSKIKQPAESVTWNPHLGSSWCQRIQNQSGVLLYRSCKKEKKNQLCKKNVLEIFCKILILHFILATIDRQIFI